MGMIDGTAVVEHEQALGLEITAHHQHSRNPKQAKASLVFSATSGLNDLVLELYCTLRSEVTKSVHVREAEDRDGLSFVMAGSTLLDGMTSPPCRGDLRAVWNLPRRL